MKCPYCEAEGAVRYVEDVTSEYRILKVRDAQGHEVFEIKAQPEETWQEATNDRLYCADCLSEWDLPPNAEVEFRSESTN